MKEEITSSYELIKFAELKDNYFGCTQYLGSERNENSLQKDQRIVKMEVFIAQQEKQLASFL